MPTITPTSETVDVAFFENRLDNKPRPLRLTWSDLAKRLLRHTERQDKDGPLWSPAHYPKGSTRGNKNVMGVTAAVGDFDSGLSYEEVRERLNGYEYVAHSTFSSAEDAPKFRVVIPFSKAVMRNDWPAIKARIDHHVFGLASDPATKDASRAYYLPSCPPGALRFAERHDGQFLDPRGLPEVPRKQGTPDGTATDSPRVPLGRAALDFVANGAPVGEQRTRALAAARNYLSAGHTVEQTTEAIWRGLQACAQEPDREPWTYEDAEHIASDLAGKPAPPIELYPEVDEPSFRREGLGYVYEPKPTQVRFLADYINHRGDDITAELVVESSMPGVPTRLYRGRLNLCATNTKRNLAGDLEGLCRKVIDKETWRTLLEQFSQQVMDAEREGEPFTEVGGCISASLARPEYHVQRLLLKNKPNLVYGPGGVGKGWVAVAVGCAVQLGRDFAGLQVTKANVLYLDWEDDRATLDMRVAMVARGMNLPSPPRFKYRRCRAPVCHQVNQISRFVSDNQIGFVIVDSVGLAAGAAGERGTYEETALRLFDALRQMGTVTWLLIDHVSEAARQTSTSTNKAYGSVYKMNEARMAWEIRKDQMAGSSVTYLGMYNTKCNHGPIQMPLGLKLDFSQEGTVSFERQDVRDSEELSKPLSDPDKMLAALRHAPMSTKQVADAIGKSEVNIRQAGKRLRERGLVLRLDDDRWALVAKPENPEPRAYAADTVVEEIPF